MARLIQTSVSLLILLLAAWVVPASAGNDASLLDYELKRLEAPESERLSKYSGKPVLMVFFEPDCNWCFRQVKAIDVLSGECPGSFEALLVGVNANRTGLQKSLRRLGSAFPAFEASPELLQSLGGVPATPFTLLGAADGKLVSWMRGYQDVSRLEDILREEVSFSCPARG